MSELDRIIPPEILNDELYQCIMMLSEEAPLTNVLEIGSSAGTGSTEAFVRGLGKNPSKPRLFCMEIAEARFNALQVRYSDKPFVHCIRASSVSLENFVSEKTVSLFYQWIPSNLNHYPLQRVLGWLHQDRDYLTKHNIPLSGIRRIKSEFGVDQFDMVLIDGSSFLAQAELNEIYGAGIIIMDDIQTLKNYANYKRLQADPAYWLAVHNSTLRNGFAIFIRH